jgi:diguanylate cyclase (GGDEF)-like protein
MGRYGGEEFSAILPGAGLAEARLVGERLRAAVASLAEPHLDTPLGIVTISVGTTSTVPDADARPDRLIGAADAALYRAKGQGRNQVVSTSIRSPVARARRPASSPQAHQHMPMMASGKRGH